MPEDGAWQHGGLPRRNHRQRDFPARFRRGTSRNRALSPEAPFHAGRFEPAARAPSVRCERMRLRVALCEYFMTTFNDFGLPADINRPLAAKDYTVPTPNSEQRP